MLTLSHTVRAAMWAKTALVIPGVFPYETLLRYNLPYTPDFDVSIGFAPATTFFAPSR